jgi:hypothetical protein
MMAQKLRRTNRWLASLGNFRKSASLRCALDDADCA